MVFLACSIDSTSRTKFDRLSHLVALSTRCCLTRLWPIPAMTQLIFKESLIVSHGKFGWEICEGPPLDHSRPWCNQIRTCDTSRAAVLFPRCWLPPEKKEVWSPYPTLDACAAVWSDPCDLDGDGDFNNGWSHYYVCVRFPCPCDAGEEQRWQTYRLRGEGSECSVRSGFHVCG